ncbi:MAG: hypothetical protein GC202_10025 [Alphaproteobacteria bacterium]|nr:hypothetical protein [Alphaproteobacteria bacterium]
MRKRFPHCDFRAATFDIFVKELGRVALVWNDLHVSLAGLVSRALGIKNELIGNTILYSINSDRNQRTVLKSLVNSQAMGLDLPAAARKEISWLIDQSEKIENDRNNLLHTPFVVHSNQVSPLHLGVHKRGLEISKTKAIELCRWFYDVAVALSDFAVDIDECLRKGSSDLPRRPKLPVRPK